VTVRELPRDESGRNYEGSFQVSLDPTGDQRWSFVPCNAREVAESVVRLNAFLEQPQRVWKVATLFLSRHGQFELKYDYER